MKKIVLTFIAIAVFFSCTKEVNLTTKNYKLSFIGLLDENTKAHWNDTDGQNASFEWDATYNTNAEMITTVFGSNSILNWDNNNFYTFTNVNPIEGDIKRANLTTLSGIGKDFEAGNKTISFSPTKENAVVTKETNKIKIVFSMPNEFAQSGSGKLSEFSAYSYIYSKSYLEEKDNKQLVNRPASFNAVPSIFRISLKNDLSTNIEFNKVEIIALDNKNDTVAIFPNKLIFNASADTSYICELPDNKNYHKIISVMPKTSGLLVKQNETHKYYSYILPIDNKAGFKDMKIKFTVYAKKKSDDNSYIYTIVKDLSNLDAITGEKRFLSGYIYTFLLNLKSMEEKSNTKYYSNGEYSLCKPCTKANPFNIIFTGDGYIKEDFKVGGKFDTDVQTAIDALFAVEPYKSLIDYFRVYKIAFYSNDRGTSYINGVQKNTYFNSQLKGSGSTHIQCNDSLVYERCKIIPGIDQNALFKTSCCLIVNEDYYAGTCSNLVYTFKYYGNPNPEYKSMCVAMSTIPTKYGENAFGNTILHELAGHGIGRLADEYINHYGRYIDAYNISNMDKWQKFNYYKNVSHTNNRDSVSWKNLLTTPGYEHVDVIEGAFLFEKGAYKSEPSSCMIDNIRYFNSQSRYLIMERILHNANESFDFNYFIKNDKARDQRPTKSLGIELLPPLSPPEFKEKIIYLN